MGEESEDRPVTLGKLYRIIHEHIGFLQTASDASFDRAVTNFLGALGECVQVNRSTIWENYTEADGHFAADNCMSG